jgi:hypothetical protein
MSEDEIKNKIQSFICNIENISFDSNNNDDMRYLENLNLKTGKQILILENKNLNDNYKLLKRLNNDADIDIDKKFMIINKGGHKQEFKFNPKTRLFRYYLPSSSILEFNIRKRVKIININHFAIARFVEESIFDLYTMLRRYNKKI